MKTELPLVIAAVFGFHATPVFAQATPGDPAGVQTIPEQDRSRPEELPRRGADDGLISGRSDSLGNRPNNSGVIKPPAGVDPGLVKPAPELNPNSMPVIPPAKLPGGAPQAK
ncbi:MAG: hypothetical protein WDN46_06780 [Methylocella sp.]